MEPATAALIAWLKSCAGSPFPWLAVCRIFEMLAIAHSGLDALMITASRSPCERVSIIFVSNNQQQFVASVALTYATICC